MPNKPISFTGKTVYQGNGRSITHDPRGPINHITGASNSGVGGPSPSAMKNLNSSLHKLSVQLHNSNLKIRNQIEQQQKKQAENLARINEENNRRMAKTRAEQQKQLARERARAKANMEATQARIRADEEQKRIKREELKKFQNWQDDCVNCHAQDRKNRELAATERCKRIETSRNIDQLELDSFQKIISLDLSESSFTELTENKLKVIDNYILDIERIRQSLTEHKRSAEQFIEESNNHKKNLEHHIPLINGHFDHRINETAKSSIDSEAKNKAIKRWNDLREKELHDKNIDINRIIDEINNHQNYINGRNKIIDTIASKIEAAKVEIDRIITSEKQTKKLIDKMKELAPPFTEQFTKPRNPPNELAYKVGQLAAFPVAAAEMVEVAANIVVHPLDTGKSLYDFAKNDNKLDILDNDLATKLDLIKREDEKGTLAGSFKAGLENNKLVIDNVTLAMGGAGLAKTATSAALKGAKIANEGAALATKAELLVIDAQKANKIGGLVDKFPVVM